MVGLVWRVNEGICGVGLKQKLSQPTSKTGSWSIKKVVRTYFLWLLPSNIDTGKTFAGKR